MPTLCSNAYDSQLLSAVSDITLLSNQSIHIMSLPKSGTVVDYGIGVDPVIMFFFFLQSLVWSDNLRQDAECFGQSTIST